MLDGKSLTLLPKKHPIVSLFILQSQLFVYNFFQHKLQQCLYVSDKMQCGPASVEAVRRGDLGLGYDVDFVFAEVNSDIHTYLADSGMDWGFKLTDTNTSQ